MKMQIKLCLLFWKVLHNYIIFSGVYVSQEHGNDDLRGNTQGTLFSLHYQNQEPAMIALR